MITSNTLLLWFCLLPYLSINGFSSEIASRKRFNHASGTVLWSVSNGLQPVSISFEDPTVPISRAIEITSTVMDTITPLLGSAIQTVMNDSKMNTDPSTSSADSWDSFWLSTSGAADETNAERVVVALEKLGPTYVKFGQALASRPDIIPPSLAAALCMLQDNMKPFGTDTAKEIIRDELKSANILAYDVECLVHTLSTEPVAAASVGQVYKGFIESIGPVAVKVQRPGIRELVEKDAVLLRQVATFLESIPSPKPLTAKSTNSNTPPIGKDRLIQTELVAAVEEFMSRIFEELDYTNEASNAEKFASLYSDRGGTECATLPNREGVIVPEIYKSYCTKNVLVMEWIEGEKIASSFNSYQGDEVEQERQRVEDLALIEQALEVTLSQLLDTGCMHADPHGGNLLKVINDEKGSTARLAYLDFGLLATIPVEVRDGLVCAVSQLVFEKDVAAVASLFGELDLLPPEVLSDPKRLAALTADLTKTMEEVLQYPSGENLYSKETQDTSLPTLRFDKLLDGLTRLIPKFQFRLPPYFINNARALGTLEGLARTLDPKFNCLTVMYTWALNRIVTNPTNSPVVDSTLQSLIRSKRTGQISASKIQKFLRDASQFAGCSRRKVVLDVLKTRGGKKLILQSLVDGIRSGSLLRSSNRQRNNDIPVGIKQQSSSMYDSLKL